MVDAWRDTERHRLDRPAFRSADLDVPPRDDGEFSIAAMEETLADTSRKTFDRNLAAMGLSWHKRAAEGRTIDMPVVDFGAAQFLLMPAESFVAYQLQAQALRPDTFMMVAGYGECAPGYTPSRDAENEGFIEAHRWCWVPRGAHQTVTNTMRKALHAEAWPALPESDGDALVPAQEWPYAPGPRSIRVYVRYPGQSLDNVGPQTGLMLSLHNWGGTGWTGTADPVQLADRYNVVAICVDYLQSGPYDAERDGPYDFGYLQALDALRALALVYNGLDARDIDFAHDRIFAAGGSGGGNVTLMANKLAPRTFACVIDLSGMAELNNDIAYDLEGGSRLNAGYSRDPESPRFLSKDSQELRRIGNRKHLSTIKALGNSAKVVVVHGLGDTVCPVKDKQKMVRRMRKARFDVEPHFISEKEVDGTIFKDTGHSLGDRNRILFHVADRYLKPDSPDAIRRTGATDFEAPGNPVRYATKHGSFVISYAPGYPIARFERD